MARFLRHEACPQCGSRNNLGVYDDGSSFCFGCHSHSRGNILSLLLKDEGHSDEDVAHRAIPDDCCSHFSSDAITWFAQYDIDISILLKNHVGFSPRRNQIIFKWFNEQNELVLWQARNMDKEYVDKEGKTKKLPKYFTSGDHRNILPIYHCNGASDNVSRCLVLVEDATSAIKTTSASPLNSPTIDAMPLLGSHLPGDKLNRLVRLYKSFQVWLDHDKGKEAQDICRRLSLLGAQASVIHTEKDPKVYSNEEIIKQIT